MPKKVPRFSLPFVNCSIPQDGTLIVIELFHRLSDTQSRELRSSKSDFHSPLLNFYWIKSLYVQWSVYLEQFLNGTKASRSFSAFKAILKDALQWPHDLPFFVFYLVSFILFSFLM